MPRQLRPRYLAALASAAALIPAAANATLGLDAASIAADEAQLRASTSVVQSAGCAIHELALPSGTAVREYVSPAGRVFAVAWLGPRLPDLRQILGEAHWQAFLAAAPAGERPQASRTLRLPGLVVESAGHGRFFSGRAYVPDLVPEGFRPEDIR
jgi:hypothetical protein